ncbi:MAG: indolepyruvate oxidoreductase [Deltaproteobacteria bacterium]|nr:indolepyruvate oxidoreductase [Deltaproteobacteria bacterium]
MTQAVVLGNEAIARGLIEAGVQVMTAYPGTPSSEILPAVLTWKRRLQLNIHVEWSVNEKVALEVALGASWAGKRAAVAMKQVGLNVASDALLSAAYTGIVGGLVLIVCDDPGPHSSQTEQDTRLFALFAKVPVLDPATPREAKAMAHAAFTLSEQFRVPVILRPTVRVSHARQNVTLADVAARARPAHFKKEPARWAATPRHRLLLHEELNRKLETVEAAFESSPFNRQSELTARRSPLGVIACGVPYASARELLDEFGVTIPVLKIGTVYPLPRKLASDFVARCETVLVLEEPDAAVELQLPDRRNVHGRLDGTVPNAGELTPEVLHAILARLLTKAALLAPAAPASPWADFAKSLALPARPPRLCPGCSHRSAFYALRRIFPSALYAGDIGCYTLGTNLRAVDTCLDMGASITIATGLYQAYRLNDEQQPIVASIGDSTFLHSGVTGLANAVHTGARFVLVILDNGTTAMTGFQPTADDTRLADGSRGPRVAIPKLVRACGVRYLRESDPYDQGEFRAALEEAAAFTRDDDGGVAVVIARRPCVLYDRSPLDAQPIAVEVTDECDGCKYCLVAFECPSLLLNPATDKVEIDRATCVDCGQCIDGCYKGFIIEKEFASPVPGSLFRTP